MFWTSLITKVLEAGDIAADPRFAKYPERVRNYAVLRDALGQRFATRPRSEWMQRLEKADVPFAPVYQVDEAVQDPQVVANGTICELTHPTEGVVRSIHRRQAARRRPAAADAGRALGGDQGRAAKVEQCIRLVIAGLVPAISL